jgi:hypothetical protein
MTQRLTQRQIAPYRAQALLQQQNQCALCDQPLLDCDAVLDHRHSDGHIRRVIHRFCNTFLGKIENNVSRNRITLQQLTAILKNYQRYVDDVQPELHPTHRTPEQKSALRRRRAQQRRKASST